MTCKMQYINGAELQVEKFWALAILKRFLCIQPILKEILQRAWEGAQDPGPGGQDLASPTVGVPLLRPCQVRILNQPPSPCLTVTHKICRTKLGPGPFPWLGPVPFHNIVKLIAYPQALSSPRAGWSQGLNGINGING